MDDVQENSCPPAAGPSLDTAANTIFSGTAADDTTT